MRGGLGPCFKVSENEIMGQGFFLCNFLGFRGGGGDGGRAEEKESL